MDLAEHQAKELGLRYRRVRYEDLLDDPEAEVRALLEFVGEPWNPACLEFHRSARASRTASYAQVTQPLYRSSAARWRNYRDFLEPAMELLRPVIERLGYDTK